MTLSATSLELGDFSTCSIFAVCLTPIIVANPVNLEPSPGSVNATEPSSKFKSNMRYKSFIRPWSQILFNMLNLSITNPSAAIPLNRGVDTKLTRQIIQIRKKTRNTEAMPYGVTRPICLTCLEMCQVCVPSMKHVIDFSRAG
jgi:hypothetical protein